MSVSLEQIVAQMRSALSLSEPDLDTTIGTPTRKILDAVGEVIAEVYSDRYLIQYQYDIDAKTGADLDDFVRLFGFSRFPAKRAVGMVTFERVTAATSTILIPVGTQLGTEGVTPVIVQTVTPALMVTGDTSITVPVQAIEGGSAGNVSANAIRRRISPFEGVSSFTNTAALSGGADPEDDEQLRARFKATVFRNLAGTEQMFLGIALNDPSVTHANVIGATERHRERLEMAAGTLTSLIEDARYIYSESQVFGSDIDLGLILTPGVHYTFTPINPPTVDSLDPVATPDGLYDLEFEYVSTASRNDPENGVTNRVDVYVNGVRAVEASEVAVFSTARVFNETADDPLNIANFERADGSLPVAGSYFIPLAFAPVMDPSINDTLEINGVTYIEDTDYFLVNDITVQGGTPTSLSGIELLSTVATVPPDAEVFSVEYVFNTVPRDVSEEIRAWRLITTDVQVHQARPMLLNLHVAIMFSTGYTLSSITPEVEAALSRYIDTVGFGEVVQVSDLLGVIHRVPGVDAVRFLTDSDDATNYAIQRVSPLGNVLTTYATPTGAQVSRAIDVFVGDDEYPVFNSVTIVPRAQNSFGTV